MITTGGRLLIVLLHHVHEMWHGIAAMRTRVAVRAFVRVLNLEQVLTLWALVNVCDHIARPPCQRPRIIHATVNSSTRNAGRPSRMQMTTNASAMT
jgi:hypothetical protein